MKEILQLLWLHVNLARRRWELAHAREFRFSLETTIANERERARRLVEISELQERRAYIAIVAHRANKRITTDTAPQNR